MSITVFNDVILPTNVVAAGVRGKTMRSNARVQNQGGYETINAIWGNSLRQFELGIVPMLISQWQTLEGLFEVTSGGAYGFLMLDPKDNAVASGVGFLQPISGTLLVGSSGAGFGVPTYKLARRYTTIGGTRTLDRLITRPQATPALLRGGSAVTLGAGAGNAAIDLTTGIVTFVADSSAAVTGVTVGATTQVTLASALSGLAIGGALYLSGLTGADAALLNGLSSTITNISGAVYTLSVNTTGKTITAAGTGYKYPQPTETLTWTGGFYVPVHFATDEIDWTLELAGPAAQRLLAGPSVLLQEVRE
jgi:uncharacterized protein (TIGR02217 family)